MNKSRTIYKLPQAERDLLDVWQYSAQQWGYLQADQYLEDLLQALERVAQQPLVFPLRSDFTPAIRMALCNRHVLICQNDDFSVTLVRVLHQNVDIASYLEELPN